MPVIRFANASRDVSVWVADGGYVIAPEHDDITKESEGYATPPVRNGISKSGSCTVIVNDRSDYTQTASNLQALRSDVGEGDYTVYISGVIHSYIALIDVTINPEDVELYTISWKGTINPESII